MRQPVPADVCFTQLSQEQRNDVEAIAMDMSPVYAKGAKTNIALSEEKVVYDRCLIDEVSK